MLKITLQGPQSTITASTDNQEIFDKFKNWLLEYNPIKKDTRIENGYPIKSENRIVACRVKARRLGLIIE